MATEEKLDEVYDAFINALYDGVSIEDEETDDGGVKVKPLSKKERKDVIRAIVDGLISEVWRMHIFTSNVDAICAEHDCNLVEEATERTINEMQDDYDNHAFLPASEMVCPLCGAFVEIEPLEDEPGVKAECECGWNSKVDADAVSKVPEAFALLKEIVGEAYGTDEDDDDDEE